MTLIRRARAAQVTSQLRHLLHPFHSSLPASLPEPTRTSCRAVTTKLAPCPSRSTCGNSRLIPLSRDSGERVRARYYSHPREISKRNTLRSITTETYRRRLGSNDCSSGRRNLGFGRRYKPRRTSMSFRNKTSFGC